mgnify:FL=1
MSEPFDKAVIQTYEGLVGEILGRAIDFESKYRVSVETIASLKKMVEQARETLEERDSNAEDLEAVVEELKAVKIREKDLSEKNSELSLKREELMAKVAKLERQVNGKHGKAKTKRNIG